MTGEYKFFDYDNLIQRYDSILTSTSRGFDNNYDFLDIWMPGSNIYETVINFFEAAEIYKEHLIALKIVEFDNRLSISQLKKMLGDSNNFIYNYDNNILTIKNAK